MAAKAKFASLGSMRKPPSWTSSAFGASISLVHQQPFVQFNSIGTPATICTSQFNWYTSNICTSQFNWYTSNHLYKSIQLIHQQPFVQVNSIGTPATICTSQFNWYTSNHLYKSIQLVHQQPFVQVNSIGTPATICTSQFNWYTSNICTSQFYWYTSNICTSQFNWYTSNHLYKSIQLVHVSNHLILVCLFLKVFPSRALARNFPRRGVPAPFLRSSKMSCHNVAISRRMCFHNSAL